MTGMGAAPRIYAVGDIHGHLDKLEAVHRAIRDDLAASPADGHLVVHIGDYVDRGPDSRGVIEMAMGLAQAGAPVVNLMGNHDRMFLAFLDSPGGRDHRLRRDLHWLHPRLGGAATLRSYGVEAPEDLDEAAAARLHDAARAAVPPSHLDFLRGLAVCHHAGPWFLAHAGVNPGLSLAVQDEDDLIWIREPFLGSRRDFGATVIHGHTPVERVEDHGNRVAIDTGAGYGGPIACVVAEGLSLRILGGAPLRDATGARIE